MGAALLGPPWPNSTPNPTPLLAPVVAGYGFGVGELPAGCFLQAGNEGWCLQSGGGPGGGAAGPALMRAAGDAAVAPVP